MHEEKLQPRRERVFLRSLGSRMALVALFSTFAVAGIAVGAALDVRQAVLRDADAATARLAVVTSLVQRSFVDDAKASLEEMLVAASRSRAECDGLAAGIASRDPHIVAVGIATFSGAVTCGTPGATRAVAESAGVARAAAAVGFATGGYVADAALGRPTVGFALAGPNAVAFMTVDVRGLDVEGVAAALPPDAAFGVVDGRGVMLVRRPEPDRWAGQPLPESALATEILSRKEGAARLSGIDGIERIYAFTRVSGLVAPGAYAYVGIPVAIAHERALAAATRAGLVAAFLVAVAAWASFTLGDMLMSRRIRRLVETMRHVMLGESEERTRLPRGLGELDELTGIFDVVARRLKESYDKTESKVKSRTVELEFSKGMAELEKARTEALLASIGEGVLATDKDGKIIFFNRWAQELIGASSDLVGASVHAVALLQDEKGEAIPDGEWPVSRALATGTRAESPLPPKPFWMSREGRPFPVHVIATPIRHEEETIGVIAVFRDITDEMEIDRRKSEFISIASHQLRSPLTGIKWIADMLRKGDLGKLGAKQQKAVDQLFEANERLVALVNELLNVSRLEVGTTRPNPVPTDMKALLDGVAADHEAVLGAKRQTLEYRVGALPLTMIDPLLTREAVANLLSNASKYSPDGSVITLTADRVDDEVRIAVADKGIGIPQADQKKMFQKFFRAENAAKSTITGTGLGLYVVKSMVELQGGKIWFESAVGKGTTFCVAFPVHEAVG